MCTSKQLIEGSPQQSLLRRVVCLMYSKQWVYLLDISPYRLWCPIGIGLHVLPIVISFGKIWGSSILVRIQFGVHFRRNEQKALMNTKLGTELESDHVSAGPLSLLVSLICFIVYPLLYRQEKCQDSASLIHIGRPDSVLWSHFTFFPLWWHNHFLL